MDFKFRSGITNSVSGNDTGYITFGTEEQRGFINDNVLHSSGYGDIHFSSYIPKSYDGSEPYALFITLPGWEGLYFQGVGKNMDEDFGVEAIKYNSKMIVLSAQLNDWGETSANQTIALTEYFLKHYNIDKTRVYLQGYSGGGETGSIVIGKRPDLYTAFLCCSTKWDGDYDELVKWRTPVYFVVGEDDSYYGSEPLIKAYNEIKALYKSQAICSCVLQHILTLDIKDASYFSDRGFSDQHAGGQSFAKDKYIMGWLFSQIRTR